MPDQVFRLSDEFPPVPLSDWLAVVEKDLKGASFDKKLVTRTYEGLPIQPLYTRGDWAADGDPSGFPGLPPFTRGSNLLGAAVTGWEIRQEYDHSAPTEVRRMVKEDLGHGVDSILLRFDRAARAGLDPAAPETAEMAGRDGVMLAVADDLAAALDGIDLHRVPVSLLSGAGFIGGAALLADLWARWEVTPTEASGAFNADPLGALAAGGRLPTSLESSLADMAALAVWTNDRYKHVTSVMVDTSPWHEAGASAVQELAFAMSTGLSYLKSMTAYGMDIDAAAGQIVFSFSSSADFFLEISKLRAARRVWARLVQACGGGSDAQAMQMHVRTSRRMMSRRDPWVNILRTTVGAFAAGVAGADSITVSPFDAAIGASNSLSRRIARNVQVILQEESHLNHVIDPAGGGWYLEKRTDETALAAWTLFQEIEDRCGMEKVLRHGWAKEQVAAVFAERLKNIARRKDPITGVSEFPNLGEEPVVREAPDLDGLRRNMREAFDVRAKDQKIIDALAMCSAVARIPGSSEIIDFAVKAAAAGAGIGGISVAIADQGEHATVDPLEPHRFAEPYEDLRDAAEEFAARTGRRPAAFLANLGTVAQHTARARWIGNLLEAGGFEIVAGKGFADAASAAEAFRGSGAPLAVICSADPVYAELAAPTAAALKEAGARRVLVAGRPGDQQEQWRAAGVDGFISIGCDVLDTLSELLQEQGVKA